MAHERAERGKKKFLVLAFQSRHFFRVRVGGDGKPSASSFRDPKMGHNVDPRPNADFGGVFGRVLVFVNNFSSFSLILVSRETRRRPET